jgi:SAM-dependent methyltransferase
MQVERIAGVAEAADAATVVDLGCGYGYLLARLRAVLAGVELRGGEYASSGVELARRLHQADEQITVERFDFLSPDPCRPMERARAPVVVVTAFALHQLPSSAPAVEVLHRYRERIAAVVTFEPEDELFGGSLLGLMRLRYQQLNDYSADVLRELRARDDVEVETVVPNLIGVNALLPGTLAVWRFTR